MGLTKIAITCLLLAIGQARDGVVYTNLRSGRMAPDVTNPQRLAEIRELQLFMSQDKGLTWNQVDKITPDKEGFNYFTPSDGEYWYHVVIITQQGKQEPADLYKAPPTMKLVVDTKPPELKIVSAQRDGDDLVVAWSVREDNPDPFQLKLEYKTADSTSWTPIAITPSPQGKATARLNTLAPVTVRLQFKDLANNPASVEAQVPGNVAAAGYNPQPAGQKAADFGAPGVAPPPAPVDKTPLPVAPPEMPTAPGISQQSVGSAVPPPVMSGKTAAAIASTGETSQGSPVPLSASQPRVMPDTQVVNEPEIAVEYEVSKVGPSGVGKVEIWITRDAGASWARFAEDPDAQQATNGGKYTRTLTLPGEGVFGISLLVKSKAGMGKQSPRPGDVPDMMIEVDTTPPKAQLLPLSSNGQQRETLILSWNASDRNLAATPITIEWAERPNGPWNIIAGNIVNSGSFPWRLPPNLPSHVYLRLTVRDRAGNVAVAVTPQPQLVDMSEPEGRLLRVIPVNKK